ncbi:hypothetical protein ACYF6T_33230 [Streptomyces sp. 7R007]
MKRFDSPVPEDASVAALYSDQVTAQHAPTLTHRPSRAPTMTARQVTVRSIRLPRPEEPS